MDYDDNDVAGADLLATFLTAKNRPIRMNLSFADGVSSDVLLPQRIDGVEAICDGIEMRVYCVSLDAAVPLKTLIGLPVEVQLVTDQGNLRRICGIVAEASQGESDGGLATYQLVMRDALAILDLGASTRVFLNQTELDVVKTVLGEARRNNPALAATFEVEIDLALGMRGRHRVSGLGQARGFLLFCCWAGGIGRSQAAASRSRVQAAAKTSRNGQAEASANLTRRTLMVTWAPIFSSLRRIVPQVAAASSVPARAMRRSAHMST